MAYNGWAAQDEMFAVKAGATGWSAAALGGALDRLGGGLAWVKSACSMGSGRPAAVLADMEQLSVRGALSSPDSRVTAVDIMPWSIDSATLPPRIRFLHVCQCHSTHTTVPCPLAPTPNPTLALALALALALTLALPLALKP